MYLNLFPDMSRSQYGPNNTFIYAAPVESEVWTLMHKFARHTNEYVGYLLPEDLPGLDDAVIILRTPQMTDDDCLAAQAYIRMVERQTHRAYCIPSKRTITDADRVNFCAGAPRSLCKMLTLDNFTQEAMENNDIQTV